MTGYGLSYKPPTGLHYNRLEINFLLSDGQTSSADWCYDFGSTAVQKMQINFKPKVAAAEVFMCSDEIFYKRDVFVIKINAETTTAYL